MKSATCILLPVVAIALSACGSSTSTPSQPSSKAAKADPYNMSSPENAAKVRQAAEATATAAAKAQAETGKVNKANKTKGAATQPRKVPAATPPTLAHERAAAKAKPGQQTGFGIGSGGVSAVAPAVKAGLPFSVALMSLDGKVHKVTIGTPSTRTVDVPARGAATVRLPAMPAGEYSLAVDGKRFKPTLSVVKPRA